MMKIYKYTHTHVLRSHADSHAYHRLPRAMCHAPLAICHVPPATGQTSTPAPQHPLHHITAPPPTTNRGLVAMHTINYNHQPPTSKHRTSYHQQRKTQKITDNRLHVLLTSHMSDIQVASFTQFFLFQDTKYKILTSAID